MHPFTYRNGALHAEDVPLAAIAEAVGTPFYCYSSGAIEESFKPFGMRSPAKTRSFPTR